MVSRMGLVLVATACLSGCAGSMSATQNEGKPGRGKTGIGIALAGGGTKAASYSMGVLAAAADDGEFNKVDAISSVSGGGYSALFLYSKLLLKKNDPNKPKVQDFFSDCIPSVYRPVLPSPYQGTPGICSDSDNRMEDNFPFRFQQFVRCRQDVLENDCKQQLSPGDTDEYATSVANTAGLLVGTAGALVPNFVATSLFDWPINLSPTRYAYREGIGTAYALYPLKATAVTETSDIASTCGDGNFMNCEILGESARVKRDGLTFTDLRTLQNVPVWYINATASRSRSVFGWAQKGERDFTKYTMAMSPFEARSGFYGAVQDYEKHLDLLEGVVTAAAFFDPNETSWEQPKRMLGALGQHAVALDWGIDIPNPNVSAPWRLVHSVFPFPFYFIDGGLRQLVGGNENAHSSYIRLIDGGNNDNLGAYTLFQRGIKHLIIADDSQDVEGEMDDICLLHNEIRLRSSEGNPQKLVIPGLENLANHCLGVVNESQCGSKTCDTVPAVTGPFAPGGYSVAEWKYPVVLGCIKSATGADTCEGQLDVRVYLLKPALDLKTFMQRFLEGKGGKYVVKAEACTKEESGACEVAAYIAERFNRTGDLGAFPQNGTVSMTFASTGKLFGAYRELARWQTKEALKLVNLSDQDFSAKVSVQTKAPIALKSH